MTMNNYIKDRNPLDLAAPPQWWLKRLWDFDDTLVVVPSRMTYCYRLAQRRPPDAKTNLIHNIQNDSDSQMLKSYGLVPVTTIKALPRWDNPLMWVDLAGRMPSRNGGAEQYEAKLLAKEREVELKARADRDDMLDQVGKDSFKFYNLKRGVRSQLWSPATKVRDDNKVYGKAPMIKIASKYSKSRG